MEMNKKVRIRIGRIDRIIKIKTGKVTILVTEALFIQDVDKMSTFPLESNL